MTFIIDFGRIKVTLVQNVFYIMLTNLLISAVIQHIDVVDDNGLLIYFIF